MPRGGATGHTVIVLSEYSRIQTLYGKIGGGAMGGKTGTRKVCMETLNSILCSDGMHYVILRYRMACDFRRGPHTLHAFQNSLSGPA